MSDAAKLRAEAQRLRTAAGTMRKQAADLAQGVGDLQHHYPAGSSSVWGGKNADTFFAALSTARTQLRSIESDVDSFASACERTATQLDAQAAAAGK